jgi:anti-anti-sigma factor
VSARLHIRFLDAILPFARKARRRGDKIRFPYVFTEERMPERLSELLRCGSVNALIVTDEIDIANMETFENEIQAALADSPNLIVSLERCNYIDSSGLRVLIRLSGQHAHDFVVVVPPDTQASRNITVAGLGEAITLFDTLEEAIRYFGPNLTLAQT